MTPLQLARFAAVMFLFSMIGSILHFSLIDTNLQLSDSTVAEMAA